MTFKVVICTIVLLVSVVSVHGYGSGAPGTACETLAPKHPQCPNSQPLPLPYDVRVSNTNVKSGQRVTVTVSKTPQGPKIQGFFFQARAAGSNKPVGTWDATTGDNKGVNCGQENNSLTHVSKVDKDTVAGFWVAPAPGKYEIQ